jgi:polar amino acid transport system substrate-binding protein
MLITASEKRIWVSASVLIAIGATALTGCSSGATSTDSSSPVASSAAAVPSLLPSRITDAGVLRVATSLYAPVDFYEADGSTLTGFDADIVNEIGSRLGVAIEWNVIDFSSILPGMESGQYDFATDLNDTKEREEVVDFVTEFKDGTSVMVPKGNPKGLTDLESLCGSTVVVTKGSTQVALVDDQSKKCTDEGSAEVGKLEVPDDPEAMLVMASGRADAYLVNTLAGSYASTHGDADKFEVLPGVYDDVFAGFVFSKSETQLRDAIQVTLQSMIDDGKYMEILNKYGIPLNAIEVAQVNAAKS